MDSTSDTRDRLCITTIRTLAMGAVQGRELRTSRYSDDLGFGIDYCASIRTTPIWPNRDRFVLSVGHASMLLNFLRHLCGVKAVNDQYEQLGEPSVTLDDIKRFRQLESKCPGHPDYRWTLKRPRVL